MIVISPTDLRNHQKKYLEMAETQPVAVKRGNKLIHLVVHDRVITDEDIRNGLTEEELLDRIIPRVEKLFDKK